MGLTIHPKRRHLYLIAESTNGTYSGNASLFQVANAALPTMSLKFTPNVEFQEFDRDGSSLQQTAAEPGAQYGNLSFDTRLIGPATKGVAGPLSPLFKALGLSETLVAGTSATYVEDPNSGTTLSIGFGMLREDGTVEVEHALAGARVLKLEVKADDAGKPIMCSWELQGKMAYVTTAPVAIDNATPNNGITYVDDHTQGFRMIGVTVRSGLLARQISSFNFSVGRAIELGVDIGDLSGRDYAHIGKTDPTVKIDPTKVAVATASDLVNIINGSTASAAMTCTAPGGGTFQFSANLQPISMSDDAKGTAVSTWGIQAKCRRTQNGVATDASDAWKFVFA